MIWDALFGVAILLLALFAVLYFERRSAARRNREFERKHFRHIAGSRMTWWTTHGGDEDDLQ